VAQALDRATELSAAQVPPAARGAPGPGGHPGAVCNVAEGALEGEPSSGAAGGVRGEG